MTKTENPQLSRTEVTEAELKRQVHWLKSLRRSEGQEWGNDNTPGLAHELLRHLWRAATSDDHAKRIVDRVTDGDEGRFCPAPVELTQMAADVSAVVSEPRQAKLDCALCGGSGWQYAEKEVRGELVTGVDRCVCMRPAATGCKP